MEQKYKTSVEVQTKDLLEEITENTKSVLANINPECTYIGTIADIDEDNCLWIELPQTEYLLEALVSMPVTDDDIGRRCSVVFVEHDVQQPLVTGLIFQPNAVVETINIKAKKNVTLQCGNSQISLDEHGRVKIRGEQISSQSYGANRVKGASVKLN